MTVAAAAAWVAGVALVWLGWVLPRLWAQQAVRRRLRRLAEHDASPTQAMGRRRPRRPLVTAGGWARRVEENLAWAGLPFTAREAAVGTAGMALAGGLAGWVWAGPWGAGALSLLAAFVPWWAVRRKVRSLGARAEQQLADALRLTASALGAGHGLSQALASAAAATPPPLGPLLAQAHARTQLGVPLEEALADAARRLALPDLSLAAAAMALHQQVGGNLADILRSLATTVRDRLELRQRLRAATAQNRLSATILGLLPAAVGVLLMLVAPSFLSVLWTTPLGRILLLLMAVLEAAGAYAVRAVSRVDV